MPMPTNEPLRATHACPRDIPPPLPQPSEPRDGPRQTHTSDQTTAPPNTTLRSHGQAPPLGCTLATAAPSFRQAGPAYELYRHSNQTLFGVAHTRQQGLTG
ncbi:hypothetical protein PGT21_032575 [Puccinia graminis f. sp. tritici]|uniref:Uncharacterized protein n=1 Tax=Puccinia graminis f. sp. tritici TaxID=56615 RepID=A0A5B0QCV6_PUCGR|nr:hypothetical protein PGT21_032575 [Puccinia graminis f. sp. tritici]